MYCCSILHRSLRSNLGISHAWNVAERRPGPATRTPNNACVTRAIAIDDGDAFVGGTTAFAYSVLLPRRTRCRCNAGLRCSRADSRHHARSVPFGRGGGIPRSCARMAKRFLGTARRLRQFRVYRAIRSVPASVESALYVPKPVPGSQRIAVRRMGGCRAALASPLAVSRPSHTERTAAESSITGPHGAPSFWRGGETT
ncbi:hypothetical protein LX36DRAFT_34701 [Colletotrichum falcatum]|nr:hypothetical protein LX36DRAFT_34701 [Colletotrichum falcatum]